ncbi:MAG: 50S ribosomal protein L1 [Candidatus Dormibacteria bacterium]
MTRSHGKQYREAAAALERGRLYEPEAAVTLARQTSTANFDASIEAHVRLGVDPRHADQMVRSSVVLPHGTGRVYRIAVFAIGEKARDATEAGADIVGGEDLVKKVSAGDIDFDVALATPDLMPLVGRLGKILGPRGMMPNPKAGTVTFDIAKAVRDVQGGRIEFRVDKFGIIHSAIGKASFDDGKLRDNFAALMDAIVRAKPTSTKGTYVRTVTLAATMGPGVHVDPSQAARMSAG